MPQTAPTARRPRRWLRIGLIVVAVLVLLPVIGLAAFLATFDANAWRPRIEQAVQQATGRKLALNGPLSVKLSLWPTVRAENVALANMPGGSRPEMVTLGAAEAQLGILPLLSGRVEIRRLLLVKPDILLETDKAGQPNWRFTPPPGGTPPAAAPASPRPPAAAAPSGGTQISIRSLRIEDGRVTWRDGKTGASTVLALARVDLSAESDSAPMLLAVQGAYDKVPFTLDGTTGPLAALRGPPVAPWPVKLTLAAAGAKLAVDGTVKQPTLGQGYALKIDGTLADLAALDPFMRGTKLPPLRDITLSASLADSGGPFPAVSGLKVHAGDSDLGSVTPGLKLAALDVAVPALDQPVRLAATGAMGALPLKAEATLGSAEALLVPGKAPFPVALAATAGTAEAKVNGTVASPMTGTGIALKIDAKVPDIASLSPLARRPLPALRDIVFSAALSGQDGELSRGVVLKDIALTMPQGDVAGALTLRQAPRPSAAGELRSKRLDVDALLAAIAGNPVPPAAKPGEPARPAPAAPSGPRRLIPDTKLPFDALKLADADLRFAAGEVISGRETYRDLSGRLLLQDGNLHLDPFAVTLPAGAVRGALSADAARNPPPVSLTLHAPALSVPKLLAALGEKGAASGTVELDAAVNGAGDSPRAIAAGAAGHLGLAMVGGSFDQKVIGDSIGEALRIAGQPALAGRTGPVSVRCMALRLEAKGGIAQTRAMLLDSSALVATGSGDVDLRNETLNMTLNPRLRINNQDVVVPVKAEGSIVSPRFTPEAGGLAAAAAAAGLGKAIGGDAGKFLDALAGRNTTQAPPAPDCARELSIARGGAPGPVPAAAPAQRAPAQQVPAQKAPANPLQDVLKRLFH